MSKPQSWPAIIGGEEICAAPFFEVRDPTNDSVVAQVTQCTPDHLETAVQSAHRAFPLWAGLSAGERESTLLRFATVVDANKESLIDLLVAESGSTLIKAQFEVSKSAQLIRTAAGEARRLYGETFPNDKPHRMSMVVREPIGVVAAISPFNAPLALLAKMTLFALAAGNTIVAKPSELTPLCAIRFAQLALEAGIPPGVLNIINGPGPECGEPLARHPLVRGLSFTGSTAVGSHLGSIATASMKRLQLELGGKNPLIILDDFDPKKAAEIACQGGFTHAGQICMASNKVIVQREIYDEFCAHFKKQAEQLHLGELRDPSTAYGPLISQRAVEKVQSHIKDALENGATLLTGGSIHKGLTFQPTILLEPSRDATIWNDETFGPVVTVVPADNLEHALELANDTVFGLSAGILTHHTQRAFTLARKIKAGSVHVGMHSFQSDALSPIGGYGMSGVGRSGGKYSVEAFTNQKWLSVELGESP